ncbi:MAG: MBOAT family protein [Prolixibacteraceae bacterium]|nr:MBOAT family protein [Prolixibacteraceae bacterium]MBN2775461.1 MBOAT family protein [Prolixibacteraceae bacterium]
MNLNYRQIINELFVYSPETPILFTHPVFWVLFAIIMGFYSFLYKKSFVRNFFLLIVSLFIYYKANGSFLILLVFSCLFNFLAGNIIERSSLKSVKKTGLAVSVSLNLLILAYFKYAYFFTESFNRIFNSKYEVVNWLLLWENNLFGTSFDATSILLPVGISFYTFQAISYLVDVYRNRVSAVKNVFDFSFYLAFFPQLVAGPIVRASAFIPQLYQKYRLTNAEFGHAVFLILKGLVKKIVFADFIAVNFIDRIFSSPISYSGIENILGVYGYSLQIYADFSGYTDIAIGLALILGFKLPVNFNEPYKATSLTNFWRRWHISLSLWLRDYLYIPLGGNRKGKIRTYINLLITMVLGGLWHGANLRFVIWGSIHGMGLVTDKLLKTLTIRRVNKSPVFQALSVFFTFHLVTFAWLFFRAESHEAVNQFFYQVKYNLHLDLLPEIISGYTLPILLMASGFVLIYIPFRIKEQIRGWFIKSPVYVKIIITVATVLLLYQAASSELQAFIYFRF